jgi:hypothetical protein
VQIIRFLIAILLVQVGAALTPASLPAQVPDPASARWLTLGLGHGSMRVCHEDAFCSTVEGTRPFSLFLSAGREVRPGLEWGAEANVWATSWGSARMRLASAGPVVRVTAGGVPGVSLRGSAGAALMVQSGHMDDIVLTEAHPGAYALLGFGAELPLRGRLTLQPTLDYRFNTFVRDAFYDRARLLHLGVGVTRR